MTKDQNARNPGINTNAASAAPQWAEERVRLQLLIGDFVQSLAAHNEAVGATAAEVAKKLAAGGSADQTFIIAESMMRVLNMAKTLNGHAEALVTCTEKLLGTFPTTGYSH
ncbi:hypothetical protein GCM10010909_16100 [Acidocella aquatica]|uniref:Uncharacterized protein n=1 Tax=Acidocella aquatica TaxID=1922313 RepID=A0ABQ6A6K2_9PROT|nr:hypothetical protein [Acidocella aquatica]GLR66930.1 hypothetical protein GCM10010909_16100 [Acidocella aquatica]